jgi:hypothetical protein
MRCALHSALDLDAPGRSAGQSDSPNQFFNRIGQEQTLVMNSCPASHRIKLMQNSACTMSSALE